MKKITFILFITLGIFMINNSYAQLGKIVPKPDLTKSLNDVADLGFNDNQTKSLKKQNDKFVNDLFNIVDGDKSEDDKKIALRNLKDENERSLTNALGIDGFKKYKKKMKKTIRPYKRKMKLLKVAL